MVEMGIKDEGRSELKISRFNGFPLTRLAFLQIETLKDCVVPQVRH